MKDYKARVHVALEHALQEATLQAESASMDLNAIIGDIPSGLPTLDGTQRIHNAARALSAARNQVVIAHGRLNDYLDTGIVPEDLKL